MIILKNTQTFNTSTKALTKEQVLEDAKYLASQLSDKKGYSIKILDLSDCSAFTDFFVIVSGNSPIHLKTLQDTAQTTLKEKGYLKINPSNIFPENQWLICDFGDIIVHLFMDEFRSIYDLEQLWAEAPLVYSIED